MAVEGEPHHPIDCLISFYQLLSRCQICFLNLTDQIYVSFSISKPRVNLDTFDVSIEPCSFST
jgi:hypothetical protein